MLENLKTWYEGVYMGEAIQDDAEFLRLQRRAEDTLSAVTLGRLYAPEAPEALIKNAVCAQIESYALNGTEDTCASFTVGHVSVSASSQAEGGSQIVCTRARLFLWQAGVWYAGVQVL